MQQHVAPSSVMTARERAYEAVRNGILRRDFESGQFIEEALVCEMAGVSRTPVREALNRLAAEGFLELHPRRGALVKSLSAAELRDVYDVRLMIESHAASSICRKALPVPPELDAICDEHEAKSASDLLVCAELNRRFHQAIVGAAGNTVLVQVFNSLEANLTRIAMLSLQMGIGKTDIIETEHRSMISALRRHDDAAALKLIEQHLHPLHRLSEAFAR